MSILSSKSSPITDHPDENASLDDWVDWFWTAFLPGWIERARDPDGFGFYDLLDEGAYPAQQNRRTILSQARLLFTFSHLAQLSNTAVFDTAAAVARDAIGAFHKEEGGYCRARSGNRQITGDADDDLAFSYDQSFVILGLSTWAQLNVSNHCDEELEACWSNLEHRLTDSATGLLLEHDGLSNSSDASAPSAPSSPNRAQNPHMHLYEAALQAFEMTGKDVWLERAIHFRKIGLQYFFDTDSGTIREFIRPDLGLLAGREGLWREVGHQCEWAWLLNREVELGGDHAMLDIAAQLLRFADSHGFASSGVMKGAAFDAVAADTSWAENRFLLWPQTEAIKTYAIRHEDENHAHSAQALMLLVFQRYFAKRAAYANQLDDTGKVLWPDALSRLLYHLVLALTEGARAGLWKGP